MLRILLAALTVMCFGFCACATTGTTSSVDGIGAEPTKATDADVRSAQAQILWDKGFGTELGFVTFDDYLDTIPLVPKFSSEVEQRFPLLVLVDGRVKSYCACSHLLKYCYGMEADIQFRCSSGQAKLENVDRYPGDKDPEVYWIRAQDGRKNLGVPPDDAVKAFAVDEAPLTAREGLALFAQYPEVAKGHHMFLPGSDHVCYEKHHVLQLGAWKGKISLDHAPDAQNGVLVTFGTPSRVK